MVNRTGLYLVLLLWSAELIVMTHGMDTRGSAIDTNVHRILILIGSYGNREKSDPRQNNSMTVANSTPPLDCLLVICGFRSIENPSSYFECTPENLHACLIQRRLEKLRNPEPPSENIARKRKLVLNEVLDNRRLIEVSRLKENLNGLERLMSMGRNRKNSLAQLRREYNLRMLNENDEVNQNEQIREEEYGKIAHIWNRRELKSGILAELRAIANAAANFQESEGLANDLLSGRRDTHNEFVQKHLEDNGVVLKLIKNRAQDGDPDPNTRRKLLNEINEFIGVYPVPRNLKNFNVASLNGLEWLDSGYETTVNTELERDRSDSNVQVSGDQEKTTINSISFGGDEDGVPVLLEKRWHESDLLQNCIRTKCVRLWGQSFYDCVYEKCVTYVT